MFFFFVCGETTITSSLPGYENLIVQCHNCGNMSGHIQKRRPFFTFCWIPIIPFSISGFKDISCNICNFHQALSQRPDVQTMANSASAPQPNQRNNNNIPPGWSGNKQTPQNNNQYQSQPPPSQYHPQGPPPQYA